MVNYLIKRVLIFVPTLFAISLLTFIISINAPGDPVENHLNKGQETRPAHKQARKETYTRLRQLWGLDKPVFYFTITDATVPDTLHRIQNRFHRDKLERLAFEHGSWENTNAWYAAIMKLENGLLALPAKNSQASGVRPMREALHTLLMNWEQPALEAELGRMNQLAKEKEALASLSPAVADVQTAYDKLIAESSTGARYVPRFHWYGADNQYHVWLFGNRPWFGDGPGKGGLLRGDLGTSYQDKLEVSKMMGDALPWTLLISALSLFFSFSIAIVLGVWAAANRGSWAERLLSTKLFLWYSMPSFWVATMLIIYLGGGDYLQWFPSYGLGDLSASAPFWDRFLETAWHLVLPVFCWSYGTLAFVSRQVRTSMVDVLGQDFIRTARAKGLAGSTVLWRHGFRNAMMPLITLIASVFPYAVAGSLVLEYIFSIPGMGKLMYEAIRSSDYPVIFSGVMLTALLTVVGTLVADLLYAVADPRVSFKQVTAA